MAWYRSSVAKLPPAASLRSIHRAYERCSTHRSLGWRRNPGWNASFTPASGRSRREVPAAVRSRPSLQPPRGRPKHKAVAPLEHLPPPVRHNTETTLVTKSHHSTVSDFTHIPPSRHVGFHRQHRPRCNPSETATVEAKRIGNELTICRFEILAQSPKVPVAHRDFALDHAPHSQRRAGRYPRPQPGRVEVPIVKDAQRR